MAKLKKQWGFHCGCALCQATPGQVRASDKRIQQIQDLRTEFSDYSAKSRATPQMAELMVSLYEQERLHGLQYEAFTHAAFEWNGVAEPWLATKYAQLAVEIGIASLGEDDKDVDELRRLADDPWSHWTWQLRTKQRDSWGLRKPEDDNNDDDDDDDDD
jgi:hypothetical protein